MNIRYLILAKYAEFTPDSTLNMIGGDSDKIIAEEFPCQIPSVLAALKIELTPEDCAREHVIVGQVSRPGKSPEVLATSPIHKIMPIDVPDPNPSTTLEVGLVIQLLDVKIPARGTYEFKVFVDGIIRAETHLRVGPLSSLRRMYLEGREERP